MSPTSSSRFFAGRNARSATDRTIHPSSNPWPGGPLGRARGATISLEGHNGVEPENWRLPRAEVGGTVPRAVEAPRALRRAAAPVAALAVLGAGGCGGGVRQDAD